MQKELISKSEKTKRFIVERSAPIFNQKGFAGTSMSDIMGATGLTKGGIYGNFKSKDEIALAAFDHNLEGIIEVFRDAIKQQKGAVNKLHTILGFHKSIMYHPMLAGGCPILNTSIEADDTHPALKMKVIKVIDMWRDSIVRILEKGREAGEIKSDTNPDKYANIFISLIEGGVMMAKAYQDAKYLKDVFDHLRHIIDHELKT